MQPMVCAASFRGLTTRQNQGTQIAIFPPPVVEGKHASSNALGSLIWQLANAFQRPTFGVEGLNDERPKAHLLGVTKGRSADPPPLEDIDG